MHASFAVWATHVMPAAHGDSSHAGMHAWTKVSSHVSAGSMAAQTLSPSVASVQAARHRFPLHTKDDEHLLPVAHGEPRKLPVGKQAFSDAKHE
jgi:hypothetical protein